jgi:DNA-binding transcriptional MocR family regulator
LFDIHQLLANEGLTESIRLGFLALLVSHSRPIHEVLRPNFQDQRTLFATHFDGMALLPFNYDDFEATREKLVAEIHSQLSRDERAFLMSFKQGQPDWSLFPLPNLQDMPAVKWKLSNIRQLRQKNPAKHAAQLDALRQALSG